MDISPSSVRELIADPSVADTHYLDRANGEVAADAPWGSVRLADRRLAAVDSFAGVRLAHALLRVVSHRVERLAGVSGRRASTVTPPAAVTTVVVLQPGYLPWLGFFDQMRRADVFVYYDDVQYDKHGWRNRNRIKTQDGPQWLTVPVRHGGQGFPRIIDVEIDGRTPWARKHVASVRQAYARAPFLQRYLPELEELLQRQVGASGGSRHRRASA